MDEIVEELKKLNETLQVIAELLAELMKQSQKFRPPGLAPRKKGHSTSVFLYRCFDAVC